MRAVIQRVRNASCTVSGKVTGSIAHGLLVYFCAEKDDTEDMLDKFFSKIVSLRIFEDGNGKMNLSLYDIGGGMLLISQFTLAADISRGRRPSFDNAMAASEAERLYEKAFTSRQFGVGQAEALILFVIVAIISGIQVYLTKKREVDA